MRATLKARYDPQAWRRVAKPAFDALRKLRRDALVTYLMHREHLERMEELYERYLIDPGTEPVVQTSRLRLAISSVQLFIQRCLLNLEPLVRPGVISSAQWAWMKRYRVWEANRKIFLWPENWLEPEWLDMKSYQLRELEGTLLQGDVSLELAEDALHDYLSDLDKIARLEIISVWLQEAPVDLGPIHNTLHVLGRRYNSKEYFYRRYAHHSWTPWEKVTPKIDSDHVVITIWRNRPYLFWLTFVSQAKQEDPPQLEDGNATLAATPPVKVSVTLSWSEYTNGTWQTPEFDDMKQPKLTDVVPFDFDPSTVFVHAKAYKDAEIDAIRIVLSDGGNRYYSTETSTAVIPSTKGTPPRESFKAYPYPLDTEVDGFYRSFYLASRNSEPQVQLAPIGQPLAPLFDWDKVDATQYHGKGHLGVWYTYKVEVTPSKTVETRQPQDILGGAGRDYTIVTGPAAVTTPGSPEIGSLIRPFFYQDNDHTFYVEPTLSQVPLPDYDGWAPSIPEQIPIPFLIPEWRIDISGPAINPPEEVSDLAVHAMRTPQNSLDVVVGANRTFQFDEMFVGPMGGIAKTYTVQ